MIDSEKLLNDLFLLGNGIFEADRDTKWDGDLWLRYRAVENLIKGQPTVEHGKGQWEDNQPNGRYRCPECGCLSICRHNFCPTCGMDLRGEQK